MFYWTKATLRCPGYFYFNCRTFICLTCSYTAPNLHARYASLFVLVLLATAIINSFSSGSPFPWRSLDWRLRLSLACGSFTLDFICLRNDFTHAVAWGWWTALLREPFGHATPRLRDHATTHAHSPHITHTAHHHTHTNTNVRCVGTTHNPQRATQTPPCAMDAKRCTPNARRCWSVGVGR